MGMAAPIYYTADMVRALPDDGNRYEVVHGELLVTPAPRLWHEEVGIRLLSRRAIVSPSRTRSGTPTAPVPTSPGASRTCWSPPTSSWCRSRRPVGSTG